MYPLIYFYLLNLLCLVSGFSLSPGDSVIIPGWYLQSSIQAREEASKLSQPDATTDSWHRIGSRSTVMAGLLQAGVYNETDLFYSDHMNGVDLSDFQSPWLYREEFGLQPLPKGDHLFLITHGISSKADIYFNGAQVAWSDYQQGCFGGHQYDITPHVRSGKNALLVQAHSTEYSVDFGQGFADWNPAPPDNGTGVWRNIELKQTGPISLSPIRIVTDFKTAPSERVLVTVITDVTNQNNVPIQASFQGIIETEQDTGMQQRIPFSGSIRLNPNEHTTISFPVTIQNPQIWWPAAWGRQPLYAVQLNVSTPQGTISDRAPRTTFGIRHVTSQLSPDKDLSFSINGHPFNVRGAGYAPDLFLRFDLNRVRTIFRYILDMGLNTVRLEGKLEHPEFYKLADQMGIMIIAGWECCDKWEGWDYNHDGQGHQWTTTDYTTAYRQMYHESTYLQAHPSLLAFILGSDYWPDESASRQYLAALQLTNWTNPIVASASARGNPSGLGPSGMKMLGPYDWVPPNYWTSNNTPGITESGTAYGFGSEQGPGVGTPTLPSLTQFLSLADLHALWSHPSSGSYHLSPRGAGEFHTRKIYNTALFLRYGDPTSLEDYLQKTQLMDYEATRAVFEGFAINQNAASSSNARPATGLVYWMLNSAWPSLHWQLFDYYLRPAGAYFGTKTAAARCEHVAYDYVRREVRVVSLKGPRLTGGGKTGKRVVEVELITAADGKTVDKQAVGVEETEPGASIPVANMADGVNRLQGVGFLRLLLKDALNGSVLSRNVYWVTKENDVLDWGKSNWYTTPVSRYADFTGLSNLRTASMLASVTVKQKGEDGSTLEVTLENKADIPAFFMHLTVVDAASQQESEAGEITPVYWSDNYVTLFPRENLKLTVQTPKKDGWRMVMSGLNVKRNVIARG
ncbi:putative glycosyl hydrolase [Aspergillus brunneoviolaceus CBS 621.78]|uniref:Glycoside hydrolase n=1 Tax=Aspergillus brunneoviolaceus CBS 621.78 TaxID=1450534 RepID=A0ACD1GP05_9EURO|nr:glycoside hydrolase [Aspergillus brunneoviolaceus CBS 621.78]RAH50967.1 glycoside hydrolase [Aspergillus brunneoviolaceus CBS 621.78]